MSPSNYTATYTVRALAPEMQSSMWRGLIYVAWAQQFEQQGLLQQADAVYQRAMENQAEPADTVLQQYR